MLLIDYILLGVVLISVVIGLIRGFFREALSLVTWILAIVVALQWGDIFESLFAGTFSSPTVRLWVARLAVFVMVLLVGALVNRLIALAVAKTGLAGVDRLLGMMFGFARGALLMGVLVIGAQVLEVDKEPWWDESRVIPYGVRIADQIKTLMNIGLDRLEDIELSAPETGEVL